MKHISSQGSKGDLRIRMPKFRRSQQLIGKVNCKSQNLEHMFDFRCSLNPNVIMPNDIIVNGINRIIQTWEGDSSLHPVITEDQYQHI